ncbi:nucleobase:cation symporter-2 family protein [Acinetobacter larvae]|uniref:Uracil permease n=1 Tax=Acinetobacter larvae TaxID=1789224 RepID=A0A1B2LYP4_9GAMM|nr:nucleobase:cation symporter-2 family protein [Acinetobacter larvae]AOA58082.1 uracil permease [Acinetobacter larvae]
MHQHDHSTVMKSSEHEYLGLNKNIAYGLQHVLTMYGGIIAPPLILASAVGLDSAETGLLLAAALFVGGAATLLQSLGVKYFGAQLPIVQGVSFSGVASMSAIIATGGGLPEVYGAVIVAAIFGLLLTPFFARIIVFFPAVVTGCVITMIGIALIPVAVRWMMGGNNHAPDWGDPTNIALAMLTLAIILAFNLLSNPVLRRLAVLLGMVLATLIAYVLGYADFSTVLQGTLFAWPRFFHFGLPAFDFTAILAMLIVSLVVMTETTADIIAIGEIVGTPVSAKRIGDGLRADMLSSAISPCLGSFMQSAFAQNVGLVAITGIKSRFVVASAGIILMLLGLLPVIGRLVAAIPLPVLGGAGLVLFGTVAASGIRTLAKVDYHDHKNMIIVATSLAMGMIPIVNQEFYAQFPMWFQTLFHSGISAACISAILLNLLFHHLLKAQKKIAIASLPSDTPSS